MPTAAPPLPPAPFELNGDYTRAEIHARLGGSRVSCLPTVDGEIVAACLLTTFSPCAPAVVLCGRGARTSGVSRRFAQHAGALPVFLKLEASRWQYRGRFVVDRAFDSGRPFERAIEGSGRSIASVSYVVLLKPAEAG